eukprot:904409-Rhodomonas_salina.1
MADAAKLKAAVFRATNDAGDGEGDPAAMIEISEKLREHPNLRRESGPRRGREKEEREASACR